MSETQIVYLAGPMRRIPLYNHPEFDAWARTWESGEWEVISPAEMDRQSGFDPRTLPADFDWNGLPPNFDHKATMRRCCDAVLTCDAVAVLPGWRQSTGAKAEVALARSLGTPVLDVTNGKPIPTDDAATRFTNAADSVGHASSTALLNVLADAAELHVRKGKDYGSDKDPFSNVRASEDFGIPAWVGCVMRANDKMKRLQTFAKKGVLANESAADSLRDNIVYFAIATVLFEEASERAS